MTHTEFRDKKYKNNIDMVTQIETLFIYKSMKSFLHATLFYTHLFFIYILKDCVSNVNIFIIFFS